MKTNRWIGIIGVGLFLLAEWAKVPVMPFLLAAELFTTAPVPTTSYPTINVKTQCGAVGDGKTDDTAAFQKAAELIQEAGGGTLVIPKATYIVGRQEHVEGKKPYYQSQRVFAVDRVDFLSVEGNGATLRFSPGLRFGSFDPETGEVYNPPKMPFYDRDYIADAAYMFKISGSRRVKIHDLELDGNSPRFILGGTWGDTGRQLNGYGILLYGNTDVHVSKVNSHHHPLDGIAIGWTHLKEGDPATPHTLTDCVFEYNGRQGFSWVGGRGIKAYRCKFNHTGRALVDGAVLCSAPGAGLDIEAEDSVCRDGYFEDCEFVNNTGCGMVADSGDGGYSKFKNCTFWGTTSWSVWSNKPGLKYEDCNFYGSAVHAVGSPAPDLATCWTRCTFEDKPWTDGMVYRQNSGAYLLEINGNMPNVLFDACTFTANTCKSIWCSADGVRFYDCTITHKAPLIADGDFQCLIRGSELKSCCFEEQFPPKTSSKWYIAAERTRILDGKPTTVAGPCVHWGGPGGPLGSLSPSPEP